MRVMLTVQVHTIYSYQNELQKLILSVLLCQLCCALNLSQYQFLYCPTLHNKVLSSFFNKLRVLLLIVKKLQVVVFLADWVFLALFVVNDLKGNGLEVQDSEDRCRNGRRLNTHEDMNNKTFWSDKGPLYGQCRNSEYNGSISFNTSTSLATWQHCEMPQGTDLDSNFEMLSKFNLI